MQIEDLKRVGLLESIFRPKEAKSKGSDSTQGKGEVGKLNSERIMETRVSAEEDSMWEKVGSFPTEIYDCRGRILKLGMNQPSYLSMVL